MQNSKRSGKKTIIIIGKQYLKKVFQVVSQRFPKHIPMDEFSPDEFKNYKMRKSKKAATEKPVTVDYSALAMRCLLMGQTPDPSIFEIGR